MSEGTSTSRLRVIQTRSWGAIWKEFGETTSIGGIRQIAEETPFTLRRVIWVFLVLGGLAMFGYQVYYSLMLYLSYPVVVNLNVLYNESVRFPAVTFCNQNAFRMTQVAKFGWYKFLRDMYTTDGYLPKLLNKHESYPRDMQTLYRRTKQRKEDFIVSCSWGGRECQEEEIQTTLTEGGVCYTFNGGPAIKHISHTGTNSGLHLLLNIEQYEYMPGPYEGAGVKVLLHDPTVTPLVDELGMAVPPGAHAAIGFTMMQVSNLEAPYGLCDNQKQLEVASTYSIEACLMECKANCVRHRCECREFWMPELGNDDKPLCELYDHLVCVVNATDDLSTFVARASAGNSNLSQKRCGCPVPCHETFYDPILTHSALSNYYTEILLRNDDYTDLQARFVAAKEMEQRVIKDLVHSNREYIGTLSHSVGSVLEALENVLYSLDNTAQFCSNITSNIDQRINFHLLVALAGVKYVIHNNFVRGWEVIEERTVQHVTTEFYETINSYDRTVEQLKEPSKDDMLPRKVLYIMMDEELSSRLELAIRAIDNTTTAYYRFWEAEPILSYGFTESKLYETSLIPNQLLTNLTSEHKAYYENMSFHLTEYMNSILSLQNILHDAYRNRAINETGYALTRENFVEHSKKINYYRFLFTKRIVQKSEELIDDRINSFSKLNSSLHATISYLRVMLRSLQSRIRAGLTNLRESILPFITKSKDYLQDSSIHKSDLFRSLVDSNIKDTILSAKELFSDLRKRESEILDWLRRMEQSYTAIWTAIIDDVTTGKFYRLLADHVDSISTSSNKTNEISRGIIELLQITNNVADIHRSRLASVVNADTIKISSKNQTKQVENLFQGVYVNTRIVDAIGTWDTQLVSAFDRFSENLHRFDKSTTIDEAFIKQNFLRLDIFMRDLGIEHIEQRVAYDLVQLLSDIGGSIGLFVGASVLSLFEVLDVLFYNAALKAQTNRQREHMKKTRSGKREPKIADRQNGRFIVPQDRDSFV